MELSHLDAKGNATMVDVSEKQETKRRAVAVGRILLQRETLEMIREGSMKKGDVLATARIAGIMGAKQCAGLIPLCHNLPLTFVGVSFEMEEAAIKAECTAESVGRTGVEMEALLGVQIALTTIYDMCKAVDTSMQMTEIHLAEKTGGKHGRFLWKKN